MGQNMSITYKDTRDIEPIQLAQLFLSVGWSSGHYPDKLAVAMKNSGSVFTAWDGDVLVGLINTLDDGIMTVYAHYMLVHPEYHGTGIGRKLVRLVAEHYRDYLRIVLITYAKEAEFYRKCGFTIGEDSFPMFITSLWT